MATRKSFQASAGPVPPSVRKSMTSTETKSKTNHKNRKSVKGAVAPSTTVLMPVKKGSGIAQSETHMLQADPSVQSQLSKAITIPGNVGATILTPVVDTLPELSKAPSHLLMDDETGQLSVLKMQAVSPSMLELETLKTQHQLNRMASLRHSMAVRAQADMISAGSKVHLHHTVLQPLDPELNPTLTGLGNAEANVPSKSGASTFASRKKFHLFTAEELEAEASNTAQKVQINDWEVKASIRANDLYDVVKYHHGATGMQLVHAKLDSPTVHAYLIFPHKCTEDWGLPHIVQHMVYLGSKRFPHPGILERLASKCFASGSDSWIDSDHACYTITTAGKQGFLQLLPIYMDHMFFPILNESGYLTEVHHINKDGHDAGVCYAEMQSVQHDPLEQGKWALHKEIYGPDSGYFYNYGGDAKEMRENCSLGAVRDFHKKFYHPKNCCLIICGDVEKDELFEVINPYMSVLHHGKFIPEDWTNPWMSEPPVTIQDEIETTVYYPSETEGESHVKVAMVGSSVTEDVTLSVGMDILFQYMIDSPVSPVKLEFMGGEDPSASEVHLTQLHHIQTVYCFNFENVPSSRQESVPGILRQVFERQLTEFDAERMEYIVSHCYEQALSVMENFGASTIAHAVISDVLYAFKGSELIFDRRINHAYTIDQFKNQPETFWLRLIKILLDQKWATVYVMPSADIVDQYHKEEQERHESILEKLGDSGRKKMAHRVKAAMKIQSREPPEHLLNFVNTPDIESIGFLGIERQANPDWASDTLCNLFLDDINTSYVYLTVLMDTSELTLEERKYLVLFGEALLESPYVDNAQRFFTYEQMISGLSRDVLSYQTSVGIDWDPEVGTRFSCGSFSHLFAVKFQMEMKKVKEGFEWMQLLLWNTKWQPERLKKVAQRLASEVNHLKNHGRTMTSAMISESLYQMNSNVKAMSLIRQQGFLERIAQELPKSFKKVAKMLESIRMVILRPENTTVHVATSLPKMEFYLTDKPEVRDAISQLLRRTFDYTGWHWGYPTRRLASDPDSSWMKSVPCITKCSNEQILRMHSDEGSYLVQVCPAINDYNDPEYPILLTAISYFCQHEGPFYKEIKGTGYASSYSMYLRPQEGMLYFEISGANDLVAAYGGAFSSVLEHFGEESLWNDALLQSAKSSAIFELIEKENTPRSLATSSLLDYYHQVPEEFSRSVMKKIMEVTMFEVKGITKKYFQHLFINATTCAVAAPDDKVPGIIKGLMDLCGKRLSLLPPVHQSDMATYI